MNILNKQEHYLNKINKLNNLISNHYNQIMDIRSKPLDSLKYCSQANIHEEKRNIMFLLLEVTTSLFLFILSVNFFDTFFMPVVFSTLGSIYYIKKAGSSLDSYRDNDTIINKQKIAEIKKDKRLANIILPVKKKILTLVRNHYIKKTIKLDKKINQSHYSNEVKINSTHATLENQIVMQKDKITDAYDLMTRYQTSLQEYYPHLEPDEYKLQIQIATAIDLYYHWMGSVAYKQIIPLLDIHPIVQAFLYLNSFLMLMTPIATGLFKATTYDQVMSHILQKQTIKNETYLDTLEKQKEELLAKTKNPNNPSNNQNINHQVTTSQPSIAPINHTFDQLSSHQKTKRK